jgi:hypothetical protein
VLQETQGGHSGQVTVACGILSQKLGCFNSMGYDGRAFQILNHTPDNFLITDCFFVSEEDKVKSDEVTLHLKEGDIIDAIDTPPHHNLKWEVDSRTGGNWSR